MYGRNLRAYRKTNVEAEIAVASPHRIIQMLYEGLLERMAQAKGAIARGDFEYKSNRISKAVGILNGLQTALDRNQDPTFSDRMYALYDYMKELLQRAATEMDIAPIDEAIKLLLPIKSAWDQIPAEIKDGMNSKLMAS